MPWCHLTADRPEEAGRRGGTFHRIWKVSQADRHGDIRESGLFHIDARELRAMSQRFTLHTHTHSVTGETVSKHPDVHARTITLH